MKIPRLSELLAWLAISAGLVALFTISEVRGPWIVLVAVAALASVAFLVILRTLGGLTQLQTLLNEGRPKPMLRLARSRLRYRGGGRNRGPLLIYKAAAHSMAGDFEDGLAALAAIDFPDGLPEEERESWEFAYAGAKFSCLLFAEKIDEARALFDESLARYATDAGAETAVAAMKAELLYCEGEHIKAERVFETIVDDPHTPPAARAVFHYFLGRIFLDRGQRAKADEQFESARELAPRTWLPKGIDALLADAA